MDPGSKINVIKPSFAKKLSLHICKINIGIQKIGNNRLKIYKITIALIQIDNKDGQFNFFEKTFLIANISINVTFGIFFLI